MEGFGVMLLRELGVGGGHAGGSGLHLFFGHAVTPPRTFRLSLPARGIPGRVILEGTDLNHIARDFQWLTQRKASAPRPLSPSPIPPGGDIRVLPRLPTSVLRRGIQERRRGLAAVRQQDLTHM